MTYVVKYQNAKGEVKSRPFANTEKFEEFAKNLLREGGVIYQVKKG